MSQELNNYWNDLNGNQLIEDFESKWQQWNVNDSIKWFKYILTSSSNDYQDIEDSDDSDESDSSDELHENQDDEKHGVLSSGGNMSDDSKSRIRSKIVDYKLVESQLLLTHFRAKTYLPTIKHSLQFKQYGFKNKQNRKILCKYTKELMKKYPKQNKKKKRKVSKKEKQKSVEGNVEDTGFN